jgi:hypothetical protein
MGNTRHMTSWIGAMAFALLTRERMQNVDDINAKGHGVCVAITHGDTDSE